MAVFLSPLGGVAAQFLDNNGVILSGGKIYTYSAGTTTNATTYTSSSGSTAQSNPIILDSAGRVPSGEIWLADGVSYKFVIKTSEDVTIGTYDNLTGINSNFVAFTSQQEIQTATAGQTVFTLNTMQYQPNTDNLSVFVDGVNQYGPGAQYAFVETDSTTVTFTSGLHVGASVKFTTASPVASAVMNAENVAYDPPFTDAVATNVENKLAQYVSVKDFGATGDGVTDDTAAIELAMSNAPTDAVIYFPSGTYIVSDTITLTHSIQGPGSYNCAYAIIKMVSATAKNVLYSAEEPNRLYDIIGIAIYGGSIGERLHTAIYGHGYRLRLIDIRVREMNVGIDISGVYIWNEKLDISNCNTAYFAAPQGRNVSPTTSTMFDFTNCIFNANQIGFLQENRYGGGGNAEDLISVKMDACGFEGNTYGIKVTQRVWDFTIVNSWFENNSSYGLFINAAATGLVEINNRHESNSPISITSDVVYSKIDQGEIYTQIARPNTISPQSLSNNTTVGLPTGTLDAHVTSNGAAYANTEIIQFGRNAYATGTTNVLLAFTPNNGANSEATGGYIETYKPASTASTGTKVDFGILKLNSGGSTTKTVCFTAYRDGQTGINTGGVSEVNYPLTVNGIAAPYTDNVFTLGASAARWSVVYAGTGTINTSDATQKQDVLSLENAEKRVALAIKGLIKKFRFKDAVADKGDLARIHIGVLAQEVHAAFVAEGLDPTRYGLFCSDTWYTVNGKDFDEGNKPYTAESAGAVEVTRLGIRYDELAMFIISAL